VSNYKKTVIVRVLVHLSNTVTSTMQWDASSYISQSSPEGIDAVSDSCSCVQYIRVQLNFVKYSDATPSVLVNP